MTEIQLSAEKHFEALREQVWRRFCARHGTYPRDRFEDAYSEWWTREVERAAAGRPSRAAAPAAFVAEAVHRVLIDDVRTRARGIARDEKSALELVDIDGQRDTASAACTEAAASYEALAHRILTLVRDRLSARELRVFVATFLLMESTPEAARTLGVSEPRVKKDRKKIALRVGEEVWLELQGALDLCPEYEDKRLASVFELLTEHVEDCPTCAAALGNVRQGALAVVGPAELLVAGGAAEKFTHALSGLVDWVTARIGGLVHRATETLTAIPPNGRTAAAVAVAATAVAGGAATVSVPEKPDDSPKREQRAERGPGRSKAQAVARDAAPAPTLAPKAPAVVTARREVAAAERARERRREQAADRRRRQRAASSPSTSTAGREPIQPSFESDAVASASSPSSSSAGTPAPQPKEEFGFER